MANELKKLGEHTSLTVACVLEDLKEAIDSEAKWFTIKPFLNMVAVKEALELALEISK
jgi:hypothetical protein